MPSVGNFDDLKCSYVTECDIFWHFISTSQVKSTSFWIFNPYRPSLGIIYLGIFQCFDVALQEWKMTLPELTYELVASLVMALVYACWPTKSLCNLMTSNYTTETVGEMPTTTVMREVSSSVFTSPDTLHTNIKTNSEQTNYWGSFFSCHEF
jgi:hypothetical protein